MKIRHFLWVLNVLMIGICTGLIIWSGVQWLSLSSHQARDLNWLIVSSASLLGFLILYIIRKLFLPVPGIDYK